MDFSPSKQLQLAACEKLRNIITGISALHQSLHEKESLHSPSPRNSYTELYLVKAQAMIKKKEEMEQIKFLYEKFPNIRNETSGDFINIYTNDFEEYRSLIHAMAENEEFEHYIINSELVKPIKDVIKGLAIFSEIEDIKNDFEEGYSIESCTPLISKRTKNSLPLFQVILPRNDSNKSTFDLIHLGYLQVKVEGYLVRGITKCFNCITFFILLRTAT
ncbi:hypothetical protein TNCV_4788451 [Trichonephila clavipes]|nr:hypothetical protein TNCV_4788451 [Trichonephila clavipes]